MINERHSKIKEAVHSYLDVYCRDDNPDLQFPSFSIDKQKFEQYIIEEIDDQIQSNSNFKLEYLSGSKYTEDGKSVYQSALFNCLSDHFRLKLTDIADKQVDAAYDRESRQRSINGRTLNVDSTYAKGKADLSVSLYLLKERFPIQSKPICRMFKEGPNSQISAEILSNAEQGLKNQDIKNYYDNSMREKFGYKKPQLKTF